jgi:hypothetical protein
MGFNRNIIIQDDIKNWLDPSTQSPKTLAANPPAFAPALLLAAATPVGAAPVGAVAALAAAAPAAPGGVTIPTQDDYLTKLLKYVPIEVLGAYLFMAGVIDSNVTNSHDHAVWLGGLLIGVLVLTIPYDRVVLKVVRATQIAMSVVGLAVYVFAVGGWFATTTWYHQWYASIVVPVFALVAAILKLAPLPAEKPA